MKEFKAGDYKKQLLGTDYSYKAFLPSKINRSYDWNIPHLLLEKASRSLANLNSYALETPDIDFFIKMYVAKEATTSSKIEGTKTQMGEVFMDKQRIVPEKRDDWEEVQNYIKAMRWSIDKLEDLPLSLRLLKGAHKHLLAGVRGKKKKPGKIRKSQNWIGGKNIEEASFVAPHLDDVPDLLTDLEKFWHNKKLSLPYLIKASITHYQFETIHPFLDGNGRIGRLLITLYLIYLKVLDKPVLYLSDFFSKNRSEYFQALVQVREENDMEQWINFFLRGVKEVSEEGRKTLKQVVSFKKECSRLIKEKVSSRRQELAQEALIYLFSDPLVSVNDIKEELDITFPTADALLEELEKAGILKEVTGKKRGRRFKLINYLNLFGE